MPTSRDRELEERPEPKSPEAVPSCDVRTPSRESVARELASRVGNAAFARHVAGGRLLRQPAADAATAATAAPSGPLKKLRDELDDTFVDEDDCLTWIGQLGEGERVLVGKDETMMKQMAEAFDIDEMFRAVELLKMGVQWQVYWLDQAGDLDDVGHARMSRLLNVAPPEEITALIDWERGRKAMQSNYDGDPLTLAAAQKDPAQARKWLEKAGFAEWVLKRTGPINLAGWCAANDPAASVAALKTSGKWPDLLAGLRRDAGPAGAAREPMSTLFKASTDAGDRKALYEIRFGRRAEGAFDWIADGEAEWTRQENFAGAGQTRAQVEAAIAAGGPATAEAAATATPKGPLAQLRDELDDTEVDEDKCLRLMGELTDAELYLAGKDASMLSNMAGAFNGGEMTRALDLLRFLTLKDAVKFIDDSNEEEDISPSSYQTIVNRSTPQDCADLAAWDRGCVVLRKYSPVDPLRMPLAADPAKMGAALASAEFLKWVIDFRGSDEGGAPSLLRWLSINSPAVTYKALVDAGRAGTLLDALYTGSKLAPQDQLAMKVICKALVDVPPKIELMKKRFNLDKIGEDSQHAGAGTFEAATIDRMWELLERLPPGDLADNEWLEDLTRRTMTGSTTQGVTGSNRVAVGYNVGNIGDIEGGTGPPTAGAFTDVGDVMQGLNIFDVNLLHEMGHASDNEHDWTRDGGPFDTDPALGQWKGHKKDTDGLVDLWAADGGLNFAAAVSAFELARCKQAFKHAIANKQTNVELAFQDLCAAAGGPAYGTAGDAWKPLWDKVKGHTIVQVVSKTQMQSPSPWNSPAPAVGGRIYHDTDYDWDGWVSYLATARTGGKLSQYSFRNKSDFFAELYATYYVTTPPGTSVQGWNAGVYDWFKKNVDRGYGTKAAP